MRLARSDWGVFIKRKINRPLPQAVLTYNAGWASAGD